jgi:hypothetical protein
MKTDKTLFNKTKINANKKASMEKKHADIFYINQSICMYELIIRPITINIYLL